VRSNGEARWQALGRAGGVLVLIVAHTIDKEEATRLSASSLRERSPSGKGGDMKRPIEGKPGWVSYSREPGEPLSEEVKANIEELLRKPDSEIGWLAESGPHPSR
jgi:hypothetical protein